VSTVVEPGDDGDGEGREVLGEAEVTGGAGAEGDGDDVVEAVVEVTDAAEGREEAAATPTPTAPIAVKAAIPTAYQRGLRLCTREPCLRNLGTCCE
jgi:hypothetical protein